MSVAAINNSCPTRAEVEAMTPRQHKTLENRLRREAKRKGMLPRRSRTRNRWSEHHGLYVLVDDCKGNRFADAQAPYSEFANGWGETLDGIAAQLAALSH